MRIRMAVFVDEQGVTPEEEIDGIDDQCIHYIAMQGDRPIATARIIPKSSIAKIGRVAVVREMDPLHADVNLGDEATVVTGIKVKEVK